MGNTEFKVLALFTRYLTWIYDNSLEDNIDNYTAYFNKVESNLNKW